MAQQINPVDPATALILQAMNQINPVTESGNPTVAADVLNKLSQMGATQMSTSVGQAARQAGLASQLQAMRMQQAQNALMNQVAAQGPEAVGIAPMAGEVRMAEGGIVGGDGVVRYAVAGQAKDLPPNVALSNIDPETYARQIELMNVEAEARRAERERRDQEERMAFLRTAAPEVYAAKVAGQRQGSSAAPAEPPPAPPAPPAAADSGRASTRPSGASAPGLATSSEPALKKIFEEFEKYRGMPRAEKEEDTLNRAMADRAAREQFARMTGNDPELMTKMAGEYERIYTDQLNKIEARRAAAQERAEKGGIAAWLRGFRQMKGQGLGEGFRTASEAGEAFDEAMRGRIERLEDMGLEIQRARMEKINALRQQKYLTDMGDFTNAQKKGQDAVDAARREQLLNIELMKSRAELQSQEARVAAQIRSQEGLRATQSEQVAEQKRYTTLLSAQGRVTDAEKLLASVRKENAAALSLPEDAKGPAKQMRENALAAESQAVENLRQSRTLYNNILNENLGVKSAGAQPVRYAVNKQTNQRIMSTDGGTTWQPVR